MKVVAISGYFDPIHVGHLEYINMAKKLGDKLVVIVNNNYQCELKKGKPFMDEKDRVTIVSNLKNVDEVFLSIDKDKKLIVTIKKVDLAKDSADARPEVFSPGNALDAKITELDLKLRKIKLSVKAAQIDEEKSLIAKFGEGATKSGATLKGIFEKAIGKKTKNYIIWCINKCIIILI